MNTPGLFITGVIVTLVVASALALLVYGAILDGRDQRAFDESEGAADAVPVAAPRRA